MSLHTATALYFGQPVVAGAGYIIRPDTYASSVTIAIPGTKFGTTFNQNSYRSDISGYINGGSSFGDAALSGSGQTSSATANFAADGYSTSMSVGTNSNNGALPGTSTQVAFASSNFTIECWWNVASKASQHIPFFFYNNGCGFINIDYINSMMRFVAQNSTAGEALYDWTGMPAGTNANTWYHVAICRSGTTYYCCADGIIRGTISLTGASGTTAAFGMMGWNGNTSMGTTIYQDFRVTKGVARYTGTQGTSYTVPQSIVTIG